MSDCLTHRSRRSRRPRPTQRILLASLTLLAIPLVASAQKAKVESQVLLTAQPGIQYEVSAKGLHVAAVVLRGSRQVMVHDGVDGPRFDEIRFLPNAGGGSGNSKIRWSDDGSRFLYFGRVGQEFIVIVDGKEALKVPVQAELAQRGVAPIYDVGFTPGGKHWWVILYKDDQANGRQHWQLVIDGTAGPLAQEQFQPLWSPDGEHHAYLLTSNPPTGQRRQVLIVDAKPAPYLAGDLQWTGDSKTLFSRRPVPGAGATEVLANGQPIMRVQGVNGMHMAPAGPGVVGVIAAVPPNGARHRFLTIGNRKIPGSECADDVGYSFTHVYFSSDGKHFAARCRTWVMVDGKKGQEYADGVSHVVFTADGRAVYQGRTNGKAFLIAGDQESDGYAAISGPANNDMPRAERNSVELPPAVVRGNKVGYLARAATSSQDYAVVIEGKKYQGVNAQSLTFSPDGSRFAFLTGHPQKSPNVDGTLYSNMTIDPTIGMVGFQGIFKWSPDSKHVAWIAAMQQGVASIGLDGKAIQTPGMPRYVNFTADGKHVVWITRAPPGHLVFVDGEKVLELPQNLALENDADVYWAFPEDGSIMFVAQDTDGMKRFKITPGSETSVESVLAKAK